jgi:hypothetical protein
MGGDSFDFAEVLMMGTEGELVIILFAFVL